MRAPLAASLVALAAGLAACARQPAGVFEQDIYVWQRAWDAPVRAALADAAGDVVRFRVLAGEAEPDGRLVLPAVDTAALIATGRAVIAVIRIDGRLERLNQVAPALIDRALARWEADGLRPAGLEIDFDCPRARLAQYTRLLTELRARLPHGMSLSVTALPDWLRSDALEALLAVSDTSVLQVHAVDQTATRLVEPAQALRLIASYAQRTPHPFAVALPAYGSSLLVDRAGGVVAVESEMPLWLSGLGRVDLSADPADVAAIVGALRARAYPRLTGVAWFRLPTSQDRHAWSLSTLRAVAQGRPLRSWLDVRGRTGPVAGTIDVVIANRGSVDARLPRTIEMTPACTLADAANGYELKVRADGTTFERTAPGTVRAGQTLTIGWMRCLETTPHFATRD